MTLSDANLAELVAELRRRLRPFMAGLPAGCNQAGASPASDARGQAGPLDAAGRVSLSARLLAVVLGHRKDPISAKLGEAFGSLAEALAAAAAPLPGSALESGLVRLAGEFEALAIAWDRDANQEIQDIWRSVRDLGDILWSSKGNQAAGQVHGARESTVAASGKAVQGRALWLLVSGRLRRDTLRRRLDAAGWSIVCPPDAGAAVALLAQERPAAFICDDAAPDRHASHLRSMLPAAAPPLVLVRGRATPRGSTAGEVAWLPPYRASDLTARLNP